MDVNSLLNLTGLLVLVSLFVEGATELICKSLIFSGLRERVSLWGPFFSALISCGYCMSVWIAFPASIVLSYVVSSSWLVFVTLCFVLTVVVHRLSNFIHNFGDKHLDKYYDSRYRSSGDQDIKD